ncbi:MAG: GTPase, partial [Desulfomonilaceae bacterium]
MKLGIIGLPGAGKSVLFRALTGGLSSGDQKNRQDPGLGVVKVSDPRVDFLVKYHKPKKTTPVHVEYMDIAGMSGEGKQGHTLGDKFLSIIRPLDALVICIRYFDSLSAGKPSPLSDYKTIEEDMILSDLSIVEKRLERVTK